MSEPVICFGQQPCGFFPKRFLIAKINTAKKLQQEIGGKLVFFYHDSDADYRETITIMNDLTTKAEVRLNFTQENKIQKNFSPLYKKRVPKDWKNEILKQLPRFTNNQYIELFKSIQAETVADFCLEMYSKLNIFEGIEVFRSSDTNFREKATDLNKDYFADITYENEIVRAKKIETGFQLHQGGDKFINLPNQSVEKIQKTPAAVARFNWMNEVINCTHYIMGQGEAKYMNTSNFPNVKFILRDEVSDSNLAWLGENLN